MLILLCWNLNWAYALPYIMWLHSCTRVAGLAALTATQINTCCYPWAPGNAITHLFCLFGCWFTRPKSLQAQCTSFQLCWWWSLCDCNMAKLLIAKMQVLSVAFSLSSITVTWIRQGNALSVQGKKHVFTSLSPINKALVFGPSLTLISDPYHSLRASSLFGK